MTHDPGTPITTRLISAWQCITCGHLTKRSRPPAGCDRCATEYTVDNHVAYTNQPEAPRPGVVESDVEVPGEGHYLWLVASAGVAAAGIAIGFFVVIAIVIVAWTNS